MPPSPAEPRTQQLLELVGACGLVVAQPLLTVFGAAPDYFVFEGATAGEIVVFSLVVAFGPPLALWSATQAVAAVRPGWRGPVHRSLLAGLALLAVLQLATAAGWAFAGAVTVGVAAGVALAWAHRRWRGVRAWAAWLAPAPLVVLALFWFSSPVSGLVRGGDVDPAELGAFGSGDPPPVVVLVFDEWPLASLVRGDGTIDADLYPEVAALAADATWYRDTTTVANLTNFAVPSLLTGNRPLEGQTADAATHPENLFTLLGGTYRLDVTERITRLCPPSLCETEQAGRRRSSAGAVTDLLEEATAVFIDRVTPGDRPEPVTDVFVEPEAAVAAARDDDGGQVLEDLEAPRPATLDRFLRGLRAGEEPTVHFLHVLEPHTPHLHVPDGRRYGADPTLRQISVREDGEPGGDRRSTEPAPALLDRQRLQLEVAHVDRLVGDVVDRLRETGLYDDALVVLTSDHGLAFRPGGPVRGLGVEPVEAEAQPELLWVPLIVKHPGQDTGTVSDEPAETIDVLPTLAHHLGIDLPWTVDGRALGTGAPPAERRFTHVQGSSFATFHLDEPVALDADLDDVLALGVDSVLPGRGPDRWWRIGPRPGLVGRPPPGPALATEIDQFRDLLAVDLDEPVVPALLSGRVAAGVDRVAVALNGRVAAVADTFRDDRGDGRWAVMVDPTRLRDGANRVTVHRA